MGDVLMTTAQLASIKRKHPVSQISWLTLRNAHRLLEYNPYVDKVYVWNPESWLILQNIQFDVVMNIDKSQGSSALTMMLDAGEKLGFGLNENGAIIPLNREASYNYLLGLDDQLKFKVNQKTGQEILAETLKLDYNRDEYVLVLSEEEEKFCQEYRNKVGNGAGDLVVGFNTGCSDLYPNKKMTIEQHIDLIGRLSEHQGIKLVLLGGPEDTERNSILHQAVGNQVINTPTTDGTRRGICYENICDVIITGDTYGMHLAIALKKYVIVWYGVSCWAEIDLYNRGIKLIPEGLECSPCWKRVCPFDLECIKMINLDRIVGEVLSYGKSQGNSRRVEIK
jgi:heptosyltransferase-2